MSRNLKAALNYFEKGDKSRFLVEGLYGLEKESLRVLQSGHLAMTPHPVALGDKLTDPHITTDFSESQLEFITDPFPTAEEALDSLKKMTYYNELRK